MRGRFGRTVVVLPLGFITMGLGLGVRSSG
jgi:hypothetical protein